MIVGNILANKGNRVLSVKATSKIADAVKILNAENIGVVVVLSSSGDLEGILSERDIIRNMQTDSSAVGLLPVSKCMTPKPVTCTPETSVDEVMQIMTDRHIRHMPVLENGKMVGLISIGDVVKRKIAETEEEAAALREYIAS